MRIQFRYLFFFLSTCASTFLYAQTNAEAWINEIHYDNSGSDVNETIEVVIENPTTYTLSNFTVHLYNGNDGSNYDSETLNNFTLGSQYNFNGSTFQVYTWQPSSIQNGPDGMSLSYNGSLIQLLSYGGIFTATDGPAIGQSSTDIGVSESASTLSTESLGLAGSGLDYSDFNWAGPATSSFGSVNSHGIGQSFQTPSTGPAPALGDIYPLGFNSDADDEISFVTFVDIPEGTNIYFTDEEYSSTSGFSNSEGKLSWTSPLGGVTPGTVIVVNPTALSSNLGVVTIEDGGFNLAASGDVLYFYLSDNTAISGNFTFLAGFTNQSSWAGHLSGTNLTAGIEALYAMPSSNDNWKYGGSLSSGTVAQLKAAIRDVELNWTSDGGGGDQPLILPTTAFTISQPTTYTYSGSWSPSNPIGASVLGDIIDVQSGSVAISSDTEAGIVKIATGASLTVNSNTTLSVSEKIENNGTINIENSGAIVQTNGQNENTGMGIYNVSREITAADHRRFNYWSPPVQGETLGDVFSGVNPADWYHWLVNTQSWTTQNSITASTKLNRGAGYLSTPTAQNPPNLNPVTETRTFSSGVINNTRIDSVYSTSPDDFILVGNPYPSALNADKFIAHNTDLSGTLYFWDHSGNISNAGYASYNSSGATRGNTTQVPGLSAAGGLAPDGKIASCQGFFAVANSSSASVAFTNAMRISGSNSLFFKRKTEERERFWLKATTDSGAYGQILLSLDSLASVGYDRSLDGEILKANPLLAFYSVGDSNEFAIQALPKFNASINEQLIPLGVDAWQTGQYTIALDSLNNWQANNYIYLLDSAQGLTVDLNQNDYSFAVNQTGVIHNRFYVRIGRRSNVSLSEKNNSGELIYFQNNEKLLLNDKLSQYRLTEARLINLGGAVVTAKALNANETEHELNIGGLPKGIYILQVTGANEQVGSYKIYIR